MNAKKLIPLALILMLATVLLAGCQEDQHYGLDPKNPTSITIWHYYNGVQQDSFDSLLLEFNDTVGRELGIVVEARNKNSISDLADSALASLRGDAGADPAPDMFAAYAETAYIADELGLAVDLSKYFSEEELAEYVEGYLEEGDMDETGGLKIFPIAKSTEVAMLNLTDWQAFADASGVSLDELTTWEGLARVAEQYYGYTDAQTPEIENDGRAFFGRDSIANYMVVGARQLGLEYFPIEDGAAVLKEDKDVIRRLWDNYYVPYVKGHYFSHARFRSDDAKIGEIIAMVCSTTGSAYFPTSVTLNDEYSYPIESLVLPVPNFEGTEPYLVQQGAGMVVIKSDEKKEYACSVFLKWFTDVERSIAFSAGSGYLPVKKAANDIDAIVASYENASNALQATMEVAAAEIGSYELYASKPFAKSAEVRDFLETYIQDTAQAARDQALARMEGGEGREDALAEYISDEAFDAWYASFMDGLKQAAGL